MAFVVVGRALGTKTLETNDGNGESAQAERTIEGGFPQAAPEQILVQSKGKESIHGPRAKAAVAEIESRLSRLPFVRSLAFGSRTRVRPPPAPRRSHIATPCVDNCERHSRDPVGAPGGLPRRPQTCWLAPRAALGRTP
jgi:hypothetical protein